MSGLADQNPRTMRDELQALVTGALIGALMGVEELLVDVEPVNDAEGNYEPRFYVTGRESGTRLVVRVDLAEHE